MRRDERRAPGLRHLFLAALLAAPPLARAILAYLPPAAPSGAGPSPVEAGLPAEAAALRDELRQARLDLELLRMAPADRRYATVAADVLPLSDPAPSRHALWAWVRGSGVPPVDGAVLALAPGPDGASVPVLAGRLRRAYPGLRLVQVQSLLDPGLRVRFRHTGASGMLFGLGASDGGHALLAPRHLSATVELRPGEAVYTEGGDGVYPPGILIGFVEEREGAAHAERLVVRSAARLDGLGTVLLTEDTQSQIAARLRAEERRRQEDP